MQTLGSTSTDFKLDDKFLINHDTKEFVDLNEYKAKSIDKDGWTIIGYENVGIQAWWHLLSILDTPPKDFAKFNLVFVEKRTQ